MGKKLCTACFVEKPIDHFYKHSKMADGHLNKCKECVKNRVRKHRDDNIETHREYDRARYHNNPERKKAARKSFQDWLKKNPDGQTASSRNWRQKNPEKYKAQNALNNAVRDGKIERQPCIVCGGKAHAHHEDYSRPLDVIWLCPEHHSKHHVENRNYE